MKVADGTTTAKKEYEKAKKKYHSLLKKQDTLLRGRDTNMFPLLSILSDRFLCYETECGVCFCLVLCFLEPSLLSCPDT